MKILHTENSSIRGYQFFKRRPHTAIEMLLEKKEDNSYDVNTMVIKMPAWFKLTNSILILQQGHVKEKNLSKKEKMMQVKF